MDSDDHSHSNRFDAVFPIPEKGGSTPKQLAAAESNPAVSLIRQKVATLYAQEPDAAQEALEVAELGPLGQRSKHQQFMYELSTSGKSLPEIQIAWHEYYAGLTDADKHQVWREFESAHAQASHYPVASPMLAPSVPTQTGSHRPAAALGSIKKSRGRSLADVRTAILGPKAKLKPAQHFQSILFGIGIGAIVVLVFLFGFFNERFIAPFIQPSRTVANTPIITDGGPVGVNPEIIIPKINVQIPVIYDVGSIEEGAIQKALENGVVHYADTALPGQNGNSVIVGHSSNNIFNKGKYKFAFVLLSRLESGDTFFLNKGGQRYTYRIYKKVIVKPTDISVLGATDKTATATLITCDPPGSSARRLVVVGEQVSPDPITNAPAPTEYKLAAQTAVIPSNAPSLWSRLMSWLSR